MHALAGKKRATKVFPSKMLHRYHAKLVELEKDRHLFRQGTHPSDYFQVECGCLKMSIINPEGHEFILGIYERGGSLGESALLRKIPL